MMEHALKKNLPFILVKNKQTFFSETFHFLQNSKNLFFNGRPTKSKLLSHNLQDWYSCLRVEILCVVVIIVIVIFHIWFIHGIDSEGNMSQKWGPLW